MKFKKLLTIAAGVGIFAAGGAFYSIDARAEEAVEAESTEAVEAEEEVTEVNSKNFYRHDETGVKKVGDYWYCGDEMIRQSFFFDGEYTYYLEYDGTPMKDKLTYHPDGIHIIYFDEDGHEVFNDFVFCPVVGYTCYFGSDGYIYKDQLTWDEWGYPVYLNANGKMENSGWFQFANGVDYGFAYDDGSLRCDGFGYDPWGRVVFYHWNGMVARGLIQDYNNYYLMDETDGHYSGKFSTGVTPVYGRGDYVVGVNIPEGEVIITPDSVFEDGFTSNDERYCNVVYNTPVINEYSNYEEQYTWSFCGNRIITLSEGNILHLYNGSISFDVNNTPITMGRPYLDNTYEKQGYSYEAKIGVHLPAGRYRIKMAGYNDWNNSVVEVMTSSVYSFNRSFLDSYDYSTEEWWNDDSYNVNSVYNRRFYHQCSSKCGGGEYVNVTVSNGEILRVDCVESVEYLGP